MSIFLEVLREQPLHKWVEDIAALIAVAILCGAFAVAGLALVPQ